MGTADDQTKMTDGKDDTSVRVALRIRPQSAKERLDMCQVCTSVLEEENQVFLGKDKAFTYDHVFDIETTQDTIYKDIADNLIEGTFEGYNATIFAYGQTGSGKTYTMGTGFDMSITEVEVGIIPRAVEHLFKGIDRRRKEALENNEPVPDFKVNAQFMELYNEEIHDLLDTTRDPADKGRKSHIKIHEDASGDIYTVGVCTRAVTSLQETIATLKTGALSRTTGSTNMNASSSRSHAIFTLHIKQQRVAKIEEGGDGDAQTENGMDPSVTNEFETLTAKFHFVDLAGSERLKRTGATGDRAKEGISINCGLLALGNVISALGDTTKKGSHVPYRDSKLTRLLQDSLGGNSRTLMIACVSPSDRDFMETLNTLKYANRARNIKNKVVVNQDKTSKQIALLRLEIQELQLELIEYKTGKRTVGEDGVETVNDMFHENTMLQTENNNLRQRIKAMQATVDSLTAKNTKLLAERAMANLPDGLGDNEEDEISKIIEKYIGEIEELRSKLVESEATVETMKRSSLRAPSRAGASPRVGVARPMTASYDSTTVDNAAADVIEEAKKDLKRLKRKTKRMRSTSQGSDKENQSDDESKTEDGDLMTSSMTSSSMTTSIMEDKEEDGDDEDDEENDDDDNDNDDDEELEELSSGESDSEDSESEDDSPYNTKVLHENLADLTCDISIKEKLVEELEMSQRRLQAMRTQYEEKLQVLACRIKQTETERDRILGNINTQDSSKSEKALQIKETYQKKLNDMTSELKKLQAAKKEHAKLLRNQAQYERQLGTLQRELGDMKKYKVKLMNQIKEESQRSRASELKRQKEIAQLRKQQRTRDTQITRLEAEKRQKELVLRRKQEEVETLRKRAVPLSSKAAGRVGKYDHKQALTVAKGVRRKKDFSPKAAKQKWDHLEKMVTSIVMKKQTLSHMEKDMERWLKERDYVSGKLEKFMKKKESAQAAIPPDLILISELTEQIETLQDNITYVQDNIADCQTYIVQYEETKEEDPATIMAGIGMEESKYLLEHVLDLVISKGLMASQKEAENKELVAKAQQQKNEHDFAVQMCHYMVQQNPEQYGIILDQTFMKDRNGDSDTGSGSSSGAASPVDSSLLEPGFNPINPLTVAMLTPGAMMAPGSTSGSGESLSGRIKDKARRKTATPQDLLYAGSGPEPSQPLLPVPETPEDRGTRSIKPNLDSVLMPPPKTHPPSSLVISKANTAVVTALKTPSPMTPSATHTPSPLTAPTKVMTPTTPAPATTKGTVPIVSLPKVPDRILPKVPPSTLPKVPPSNAGSSAKVTPQSAPTTATARQNGAMSRSFTGSLPDPSPSPSIMRKSYPAPAKSSLPSPSPSPSMMRKSYPAPSKSAMPEPSPTMRRKANSSTSSLSRQSSIGSINAVMPKPVAGKTSPLVHSHTAEGHTKAVLSVFATEDLLFSSSKDRTAKVWDLPTGEEILTLEGHPNNVTQVRYSEETKLAFTASTYFVKVWDVREGQKCIKTLVSSGMLIDGPLQINTSSRQVSCPAGETQINDIQLNSTGSVLYSAAGNTVRIWDMRMFKPVGKLSGGHQAAVMVLAVDDTDTADGNICVVTGSKDHYIKVFEMEEDSVGMMTPKYNLEPPHYDGIQSLCLAGDLLFSGSRDTCIKKWDLSEQKLQQSINNSHKDWICGLSFMPGGNCLLSGCRGGFLKIWHIDNCQQLGEIQAHKSPINAITTNSNVIFTASNDRTISLWRPNDSFEASDLSETE